MVDTVFNDFRKYTLTAKGNMGDTVAKILLNLRRYNVVLDGDVAASLATISIVEGLLIQLYPEYDIIKHVLPYFVRYRGWNSERDVLDVYVKRASLGSN